MNITAAQQFRAIGYLRWTLFKNGFRRKGGTGELIARFILYPLFALFIIGPVTGAFGLAYAAVHTRHYGALGLVFWGIFALQVIVSLNLGQPGLNFDPESLIRFPLTFTRYLIVRLFLGLLSASTIIGTLALLAAAAGVTVANTALAPAAFAAALALSATNMIFLRTVFAWVDRWLATRRAREIFTGLIIFVSIGIQYLNFTYNPGFNHGRNAARSAAKMAAVTHWYRVAEPLLNLLPPGLASRAVVFCVKTPAAPASALGSFIAVCGILLFGAFFMAIFAWRMQREYRGENLSDTGHQATTPVATIPAQIRVTGHPRSQLSFLSPALDACLYKEWIYLRRNTSQLYGLLAPLAMVFLFSLRMSSGFTHGDFFFPAACVYSVLGIAALAYNSFGVDATGVQAYFLAPVRMGTVLFAKNLFSFLIAGVQIVLVFAVVTYTAGMPPAPVLIGTLAWVVTASLINVTLGNRRSITAPKKMDPSKMSRRQASQLSALLSLGIILLLGGLGAGAMLLGNYLDLPWLPAGIFLTLALAAGLTYRASLQRLDGLSVLHRETMLEELCKAS